MGMDLIRLLIFLTLCFLPFILYDLLKDLSKKKKREKHLTKYLVEEFIKNCKEIVAKEQNKSTMISKITDLSDHK